MATKPKIGGPLWWVFLICTGIASFFAGFLIGKILRRILIALALPVLVNQLIALAVLLPTAFGAGAVTRWLQNRWFEIPTFTLFTFKSDRQSEAKEKLA
jgi:hypothetical protein